MAAGCCLTLSHTHFRHHISFRSDYGHVLVSLFHASLYIYMRAFVCVCARETSLSPVRTQHLQASTSTNAHTHTDICVHRTEYIRLKNSTSDKGNKSSLMLYLLPYRIIWRVFFFSSSSFLSAQSFACFAVFGCSLTRSLCLCCCLFCLSLAYALTHIPNHFCFDSLFATPTHSIKRIRIVSVFVAAAVCLCANVTRPCIRKT